MLHSKNVPTMRYLQIHYWQRAYRFWPKTLRFTPFLLNISKGRKRTMEQSVTKPSVRSLLWLFPQPLCSLSVSINDTAQLNLALVVHRDSFHTKMQFSPRVSALPNGLHRISWMVSGWFLGDKLITTAIIRGSHPISGHGKIHSVMEEADLIISERLPPWSRLLLPTTPHTNTHTHTLSHTHTQPLPECGSRHMAGNGVGETRQLLMQPASSVEVVWVSSLCIRPAQPQEGALIDICRNRAGLNPETTAPTMEEKKQSGNVIPWERKPTPKPSDN